jgi:hypothetical protein
MTDKGDVVGKVDEWASCYDLSYRGIIVPEAFGHPAKMSRGLLTRILRHAKEEDWLWPGAIIVDPFGGIFSTGILGAYQDYQVIGVELEGRFVELAKQNIALHARKLAALGLPQPVIIQGDSRNLQALLDKEILLCTDVSGAEKQSRTIGNDVGPVSCEAMTPNNSQSNEVRQSVEQSARLCTVEKIPTGKVVQFGGAVQTGNGSDCLQKNEMDTNVSIVEAPKNTCASTTKRSPNRQGINGTIPSIILKPSAIRATPKSTKSADAEIGKFIAESVDASSLPEQGTLPCALLNADEQGGERKIGHEFLKAMKPGSVDAILSSPPYAQTLKGDGTQAETAAESRAKRITEGGSLGQSQRTQGYGSKGNLGNLKPGDVNLILSSPPYEGSLQRGCPESKWALQQACIRDGKGHASKHLAPSVGVDYGKTAGQLGNSQGPTFWEAARDIVAQCLQILRPGGYAIWVVKDFVRAKKRVDFTGDWRKLCESVGFTTIHEHHALLVKETKHSTFFGTETTIKARKSFFRRLCESKGSPRIDFEVVLCTRKPQ